MIDNGSWYSRERWPHDGQPFESEHVRVYSDGAGLEAKQRLAVLAEEVLAEVVDEMGVDPQTMFRYPADQDKIDLYAYRYEVPDWGGGARAYFAGVIIWSFDNGSQPHAADAARMRPTLKHEIVHVVEALLKGRFVGDIPVDDPRRMPVWFSEGMAEALSGGDPGQAVRTLDQMDALIDEYGRINPIGWRVDLSGTDYDPVAYHVYYYPMAQLALEYILDADGLGRSPEDLTQVMLDMADGASFAAAFENHVGLSESDYEAQFFARIESYLPQSDTGRRLAAIWLGALALIVAGLTAGSLTWSLQRTSATAPGRPHAPTWSPGARRGFLAEISALAFVAVALVTLLLFRITFAELPPGVERLPGYVAEGVYLGACLAILHWAIRRWADRSRRAYLIPLLVVVATGIMVVTISWIF